LFIVSSKYSIYQSLFNSFLRTTMNWRPRGWWVIGKVRLHSPWAVFKFECKLSIEEIRVIEMWHRNVMALG